MKSKRKRVNYEIFLGFIRLLFFCKLCCFGRGLLKHERTGCSHEKFL